MKKNQSTGFQTSLDKWFVKTDGSGNVIESLYKIFYLEWTPNFQNAQWISTMPPDDKITYRSTVKCNSISDGLIHIVGYIPEIIVAPPPSEGYYTNVSYIKSHLQKSIRRGQTGLALKTANHFLNLDMTELLRRLGIIMLEDVHLMDSFTILTWLMVANSKGYNLDKSQIYWLFGLVYNLCQAPDWDSDYEKDTELKDGFWKSSLPKLTSTQKSLVYSLQLRKAYGGLAGDKVMINNLTNTWINRFIGVKEGLSKKKDTPDWLALLSKYKVNFMTPPEEPLLLEEWILPAIDFHCAPNILSILSDKYEEFSLEDIKSAIWHCNSKYNSRIKVCDNKKYGKIWDKIRSQFYGLANYFLTHNY